MTSDEPQSALRNDAHQVTEFTPEGATRPVLGTAHPGETDKRAKVLRQWGQAPSPRAQRPATINEPLPQRSQTILSHEVNAALRQRLNGGLDHLSDSRSGHGDVADSKIPSKRVGRERP